jgi:hypothetical protein
MLQSLPKKLLCKYQGKMKNENAYSTYRRKNMEEKKYSKEKNQILHLQERKRNKEINIIKKSLILLIQEKKNQ